MASDRDPIADGAYAPPAETAGDGEGRAALPAEEDAARTAGRGGLAIAVAKLAFILLGFVQQVLLQHLLGAVGYGEVSVVNRVVSIVNNVMVAMSIQGVSRTVSVAPKERVLLDFRRVLGLHAALAVVVSGGFAAAAGLIADALFAPEAAKLLRVVAIVVLVYGIYAPIVGSLNGRRRFLDQAGLDITYSVMRTVLVVAGAWFLLRSGGSGPFGFSIGFALTAVLILPASVWRAGLGKPGGTEPSVRSYAAFLAPLAFGQVALNLLLGTDFLLLRRFAGEAASAAGLDGTAAQQLAGVYQGVQLFAFLPYQLLMSITFVLFPMLARAQADGDRAAVTSYTRTGIRIAFVLTGLVCGTTAALGPHVLRLASPEEIWRNGGDTLRVLALGMAPLSILGVTTAALTSLRHEIRAAMLTFGAVAVVAVGCFVLVPGSELGPKMLLRTATATSIGMGVAVVVGAILLRRAAGGFVPLLTVLRVPVAVAAVVALGTVMPWWGKAAVLVQAGIVAAAYLGILVVLRELGRADLDVVRRVLVRKKAAS